MNGSPLGKYAAPAAAVASLFIIAAAVLALVFGKLIGIPDSAQNQLNLLAAIAAGALFGSSVAVNGYKAPLEAVHRRVDRLAVAQEANRAAVIATDTTGTAPQVIESVEAAASSTPLTYPLTPNM